jgi:diguanylate cyclase (GGDEF)-like protein
LLLVSLIGVAAFAAFSLQRTVDNFNSIVYGGLSKKAVVEESLDASTSANRSLLILGFASVGGIVLVIALIRANSHSIRVPMHRLREGAEEFAKGNLSHRVETFRRDEFGEVVDMFNSMAWRLQGNQENLTHQAFHDSLTGLPNRELFADRVVQAVARQERESRPLAVMFIDLDDFKTVNDSLGHAAGDQLLITAASRIRSALRPADTAARLGGDEFAVLIESFHGERDVAIVAQRIIEKLRNRFTVEGKELSVHGSVGIAISYGQLSAEELLRNADLAMYAAKNKGKGRYEIFDGSMQEGVMERLELKTELERALDEGQLVLKYQPIVDLENGRMVALEALVRWNHPERGSLAPSYFISLAEDTGLIIPIGDWVLRESLLQLRVWQTEWDSELRMTVNISGRQLQEPGFVNRVQRILAETPMSPDSLTLEMTESILMEDTKSTVANLNALRELGVHFAIDDFGTGYSSLGYLQQFPIETIKIDKSFTQGIDKGPEDSALARAIVKLSQTLNLLSVAEGIESFDQARELRALGCQFGQGFHFARPLSSEGVDDVLRRQAIGEVVLHRADFPKPPPPPSGGEAPDATIVDLRS